MHVVFVARDVARLDALFPGPKVVVSPAEALELTDRRPQVLLGLGGGRPYDFRIGRVPMLVLPARPSPARARRELAVFLANFGA